ncbi:MAG: type III pantothenate kinase [Culicoidibacterales bacterium]
MILLIDIGNTNTVIGVSQNERSEILHTWRVVTDAKKTADEYAILFKALLADKFIVADDITAVVVASVVPDMLLTIERLCKIYFNVHPIIVGPGVKTGINIRLDEPKNAGADLIVAAVAAFNKYGGPAIIVDLGTATTITVITQQGDFIGGAIIPGLELAALSLFENAAKLPRFSLVAPPTVVGRSTQHAVQSGIVYGFSSLIDGMIERIRAELNLPQAQVIATGGQAIIIEKYTKHIDIIDNNLVLEGLQIIYNLNK